MRVRSRTRSGRGELANASEGGGQKFGPGPVALEPEDNPATPRDQAPGGVQQPVAQSSRLPALRLTGEGDAAEVAEQVVSGEHQLEPDRVLHEALEGEGAEPGLLGTSDLVLAAGAGSVSSSSWSVMKTWKRQPW